MKEDKNSIYRYSKRPKSIEKVIRVISREDDFARNGGGQFVSKDRAWKNKKKYNRKDKKRKFRKDVDFPFCCFILL